MHLETDVQERWHRQGHRTRMSAIDAVRGLAVIGMLLVNVHPTPSDVLLYELYMLPAGRASVLFVVVAGIGMTLALQRGIQTRIVLWRVAVLLVLGAALLPLPHDINIILPVYAAAFVVALLLRGLSTRVLIVFASVLAISGPTLLLSERISGAATLRQFVAKDNPLHAVLLSGPYPLVIWLVPFVVGLIVGRLNLSDHRVPERMVTAGAVATILPLAVDALAGDCQEGWGLLLTAAAHGQMPLWIISAVGSAILLTGALLLVRERGQRLLAPLSMLGRMSLTMYVLHVLLLVLIRPFGDLDVHGAIVVSAAILAVMFTVAALLQSRSPIGPLEWLSRGRWLRPSPR